MAVAWFMALGALALGGFWLGGRLGRGDVWRAWVTLGVAMGLLLLWTWLQRHPAVAVHAIPVWLLSYLEGVGAVPMFMVVTGVAWARSRRPHQRRLTILAATLGMVFFMQGGLWMLQSTPSKVLGNTVGRGVVLQSQEFTCVPAACATALNMLQIRTTEAQMAELTRTRPGTGSTLVRALDGLSTRLAGTGIGVELVEPDYGELVILQKPLLTPLRFEPQRLHMVVITAVDDHGVRFVDPLQGATYIARRPFLQAYTGKAVRFIDHRHR